MKPKPCVYCGAAYHQPYEDGLVECRIALRSQLDDVQEENDRLRAECAQMSEEFGLPPTIRPAEGELRRMQQALGEVVRLRALIDEIAALPAKEVAKMSWRCVRTLTRVANAATHGATPSEGTAGEEKP